MGRLRVFKRNALEVFGDRNKGFLYGLEESPISEDSDTNYVEWFKTKKERDKAIRKKNMLLVGDESKRFSSKKKLKKVM